MKKDISWFPGAVRICLISIFAPNTLSGIADFVSYLVHTKDLLAIVKGVTGHGLFTKA